MAHSIGVWGKGKGLHVRGVGTSPFGLPCGHAGMCGLCQQRIPDNKEIKCCNCWQLQTRVACAALNTKQIGIYARGKHGRSVASFVASSGASSA